MSRRREANRAEAIVRGIGAIIMLILLWGMVNGAFGALRAKNAGDAIAALFCALIFFVALFCAITVIGLVVWLKVLKGPRKSTSRATSDQCFSRPSPGAPALSCADCGIPITPAIANYCQNRPGTFRGKPLCMSCQAQYRP